MWRTLRLTVVEATYRAVRDCRLPAYKGSLLRGALGHALRAVACDTPARPCDGCRHPQRCAYGGLFEAGPPAGSRAAAEVFRPYVLDPRVNASEGYPAGAELALRLTLVGTARVWLTAVLPALARLGDGGLGAERSPWELCRLRAEASPTQWTDLVGVGECPELTGEHIAAGAPAGHWRVRFETPAGLETDGRLDAQLNGPAFFRRVLRRVGTLAEWYCGARPAASEFAELAAVSDAVRLTNRDLRVARWERHSNRQGGRHALAGLTGGFTLEGVPGRLAPWLVLGGRLHVGKGAVFGMGRYTTEPADD